MLKLIIDTIKYQGARKRIITHGRDKAMPDWDINVYLSMLPSAPTESDVQRIMRMMDKSQPFPKYFGE